MRLHYFVQEGKVFIQHYVMGLLVFCTMIASVGVGYVSALEYIQDPLIIQKGEKQTPSEIQGNHIVASKSGTKVYFTWCSGSKRIKEENKVYFESMENAVKRGYAPAKNCPGMLVE